MTDDYPDQPGHSSAEDVYNRPDQVLAQLVSTVNRVGGLEVGVTVYVPGAVVSGLLVSGRVYFELLQEGLRASGGQIAPVLADKLAPLVESYRESETAEGVADPEEVAFLHLRDAKVQAPGMGPAIEQGLWRGRLVSVSGWSMGQLSAKQPD